MNARRQPARLVRTFALCLVLGALIGCNERSADRCTTVCAEWGEPAAPFADAVYQREASLQAPEPTCNALSATPGSCPVGTACVEESSTWSARDRQGPFCEAGDARIAVDVREPEGAVDVTLSLEENGAPMRRPLRVRLTPDSGARAVYYRADAAGELNMRLAPGGYTVEFDAHACSGAPFIHREARLQVLGEGRTTLNLRTVELESGVTVDGAPVVFLNPCPTTTNLVWTGPDCDPGVLAEATLAGLGGASCTWSRDARPTVQEGELWAGARFAGRRAAAVMGDSEPQRVVVGPRGARIEGEVTTVSTQDVFALGNASALAVDPASTSWTQRLNNAAGNSDWVRGTYDPAMFVTSGGPTLGANAFVTLADQAVPPVTPRAFDEVSISVTARGSTTLHPFTLVASYETGEEVVAWSNDRDVVSASLPSGTPALYMLPDIQNAPLDEADQLDGPALLAAAWDTQTGEAHFEVDAVRTTVDARSSGEEAPRGGAESYAVAIEPVGFSEWPTLARDEWIARRPQYSVGRGAPLAPALPLGEWHVRAAARDSSGRAGGVRVVAADGGVTIEVGERPLRFAALDGPAPVSAAEVAQFLVLDEAPSAGVDGQSGRPALQLWWRCREFCPPGLERGEILLVDRLAY